MKDFFVKLEETFEPVREFIISNHGTIKIIFWILLVVVVCFNITKNAIDKYK